jgi:hypothetical protein
MYGMLYGLAGKGVPKTFEREMYWTCFAASGMGAWILIAAAQRVARAGATPRIISTLLIDIGLFLVGMAIGCGAGVIVFKKPRNLEMDDEGLARDS